MDRASIKSQLEIDEGYRTKLYKCTAGKLTIGIGRNIEDKGISRKVAELMLDEDIDEVITQLDRNFPWWSKMTPRRKEALVNFIFNVGLGTAHKFVTTFKALKEERYEDAAQGFENSLWYKQVGDRAKRVVKAIREG